MSGRWELIDVACDCPSELTPTYSSEDAAGADLRAAVEEEGVTIDIAARELIPTGVRLAIPRGYEGQVRPRSGLAVRHGITLLNTPGTIDSDYRGEIKLIVINLGSAPFTVHRGDRIGQLVVAPVIRAQYKEAPLEESARGSSGFGSTGR